MWTGRLEATTVVVTGALAYHTVTSKLEGGWSAADETGETAIDFGRELDETRKLMRELRTEFGASDALVRAIEKPIDGEYGGESAEDDAGDQDVRTTLTFRRDGSIVGTGNDAVDGTYEIREGRWSAKRVAWIEEYDEGFKVALRGQVRTDGTIVALWASSRGVGGSVSLEAPQPLI